MTYGVTSPVTGAAQTGFTSPTYTLTSDVAPDINGKQHAVTAVGGTQSGVDASTVSRPFSLTFIRPKQLRQLGNPNPVTGVISNVPRNTYKLITRKGVLPLAGQPSQTMIITTVIEVVAGSDTADASNVRAALSLHIGALSQQSAGIGDTSVTGIF
jgi:hypothetical protein